MKQWQMQEAKAKLSEVIQKAVNEGPQGISVRGKTTAIILSTKQYIALTSPKSSLVEFLKNSPLFGEEFVFERDKSPCRKIEL
ncbi:type II toxin-antitoxin system Phd/YefM family antitoxin [Rickettsia endosymbiont of Halotydeus destructor]|uniref:type II toxin-antitoxin system Phd/YefM family antitoxin n=1 Tax=Rickettsia endosymbiont of Halotydeus destructor TaxID=2996754 RepID=UPI003BB03163